ncbi:16S rRNA (cytosine(1402)-N(4))-methyltransferase RsmH [Nitrospira sp. NS4]|uniref:16S rRNA (cytosine(1402)-N(4))-methyltransferase RsmH n=1 Tax=Nitrospira sp. NS4 TaxID=3414498 RepID=UPI003C308A17
MSGGQYIEGKYEHVPVFHDEVIYWLNPERSQVLVDGTVGYGGHAELLLRRMGSESTLVGIDRDEQALAACQSRLATFGQRAILLKGDFVDVKPLLRSVGVQSVDGVLFDLGVSSPQLDDPQRGFSFQTDGPLDMRMDRAGARTAAQLVNELPEAELADMIFQYGEERFSRRIARAIVQARAHKAFETTQELVAVIKGAVPAAYRHGRIHCATRTFQALRIAVNRELDVIAPAIHDAVDMLRPGGRIAVISFHSLEDRIVKHTLRALTEEPRPRVRVLTKKPQVPSEAECRENPRARSAKLRVAERLPKECVQ